ncbi:MAG: amidohydrolase family protein [Thermodesulfobacteriota bacterium]
MTTTSGSAIRPPTIPGPVPDPRPPLTAFPAGACDCHAHVFGPQELFPYLPEAAAAPDRCVWGTDWPHPNTEHMPDEGDLADAFAGWLPDPQTRQKVLVDNPDRLYGFV